MHRNICKIVAQFQSKFFGLVSAEVFAKCVNCVQCASVFKDTATENDQNIAISKAVALALTVLERAVVRQRLLTEKLILLMVSYSFATE